MQISELKTKVVNGNWKEVAGLEIKSYVSLKQKHGMAQQIASQVIQNVDGYAILNRLEYELNLYYLLCVLYTNIEVNNEFSDEDYDFLASNKFVDYLHKLTDSFSFEALLKGVVIDEIRRLNASSAFDIEGLKSVVEKLNNLDPDVMEALKGLNPTTLNMAREMVTNAGSK